jgi:hypothetical protein
MKWINQFMKARRAKLKSPRSIAISLFLMGLIVGCASSVALSVPQLGERTLYLSATRPAHAFYGYCVKKKFMSDKCKEWHSDWYDLSDLAQVQRLIDLGYRLVPKHREY